MLSSSGLPIFCPLRRGHLGTVPCHARASTPHRHGHHQQAHRRTDLRDAGGARLEDGTLPDGVEDATHHDGRFYSITYTDHVEAWQRKAETGGELTSQVVARAEAGLRGQAQGAST